MAPQPDVDITTEKTVIRMDEFKKPGEVRTLIDVLSEIGGIDVQKIMGSKRYADFVGTMGGNIRLRSNPRVVKVQDVKVQT